MSRENVKLPQKLYPGGSNAVPESEKLSFDYDRVYRGTEAGTHLFAELTKPLLDQVLKGCNATVSYLYTKVPFNTLQIAL